MTIAARLLRCVAYCRWYQQLPDTQATRAAGAALGLQQVQMMFQLPDILVQLKRTHLCDGAERQIARSFKVWPIAMHTVCL